MRRCDPRGDVQEAADATGVDLWLSGERVSESLGCLFRGFQSRPDHGPVSRLTGVVPVVLKKLPPQQQQAQEGAEAQHQEQSGHQRDPGYGIKNSQTSKASCRSPAPRSSQPRPGPAPCGSRATRAVGAPRVLHWRLPRSCRPLAAFVLPPLLPVSEAVSSLTGSDQALQGPW